MNRSAITLSTSASIGDRVAHLIGNPQPRTAAFLTTYQCTAACRECCFGCSPAAQERMSISDLREAIDATVEAFPGLRGVIFTGGECFLLGRDLVAAVAYARSKGLGTRCVTNAYWATSANGVERHLRPLIEAGLSELNISTGDAHQAFVPWERVVRAAIASVDGGLLTLVTIETKPGSRFTMADAHADPRLRELLSEGPRRGPLLLAASAWVDFNDGARYGDGPVVANRLGCENLFDNLVFTPTGNVLACCGLMSRRIPEMVLGPARTGDQLQEAYRAQFEDFAKLWLWLDGPKQIMLDLCRMDGRETPPLACHPCESCRQLFGSPENRASLVRHYPSRTADVLFRLGVRARLSGASVSVPAEDRSRSVEAV